MSKILYKGLFYEAHNINAEMKRLSFNDISVFKGLNEYFNIVSFNTFYNDINRIELDIKRKVRMLSIEITKNFSNDVGKVVKDNTVIKNKESEKTQDNEKSDVKSNDDKEIEKILSDEIDETLSKKSDESKDSKDDVDVDEDELVLVEDDENLNTKTSNTMRKISDLYKVFLYNIYSYNNDYEKYIKDMVEKHIFDKEFDEVYDSYNPPNPKYISNGMYKKTGSSFNNSEYRDPLIPILQILTPNTPVRIRNQIDYDVVKNIYLAGLFKETKEEKIINIPISGDDKGLAKEIENLIDEVAVLFNKLLRNVKKDYVKKSIDKIENAITSNNIKNQDILDNLAKLKQGTITSEQYRHLNDSLKIDASIPKNATIKAMARSMVNK